YERHRHRAPGAGQGGPAGPRAVRWADRPGAAADHRAGPVADPGHQARHPAPAAPFAWVLVGGGSRIPMVATLVAEATGFPPIVIEQPELVVAEGALHLAPNALPGGVPGAVSGGVPGVVSGAPVPASGPAPGPAGPATGTAVPVSGPGPYAPVSGPAYPVSGPA